MAKFIIYADKCSFEDRGGYTMKTVKIDFQPPIAKRIVEIKTCADLEREIAAMRDEVIASGYATSFYVSEILPRGQRAPSGYRQRRFAVDVNRDTVREAVAA